MTYDKRSRRRGASLVEVLVIISVSSVVMGGVTTGIAALLKCDRRVIQADEARHDLAALADRLRGDLHAAEHAEWDAGARRLTLAAAQGASVEYALASNRLTRSSGDRVSAWRIPPGLKIECLPVTANRSDVIALSLVSASQTHRVAALIGRDASTHNRSEGGP